MRRFILCFIAICFFSGCSSDPSTSSNSLVPSFQATSTFSNLYEEISSVAASSISYYGVNSDGPFDEEHYLIGNLALQSLDNYFAGNLSLGEIKKTLSACYDEISSLAELTDSDLLISGNELIKTYVFLAYADFNFSLSASPSKKYEDRNFLAAALGEPSKDYDAEATNKFLINSFLDRSFSSLQASIPGSSFSYSWTEGSLFVYINTKDFDYFYENKDLLDDQTRKKVLDVSHGYVTGDVAQLLYDPIRWIGGSEFDIFISLGGSNVFCVSKNLKIIMDPLNE